MGYDYEKIPTPLEGLRLHLNEHTGGCSRAVLEALASITCDEAAYYPNYERVTAAVARHLGVSEANLLLTNGLDEAILVTSVVSLRGATAEPFEAIIVTPAFDMYAACADGAGGRVVEVPPEPDFSFPLDRVLKALSPHTRLVFINDPNNPTGHAVPREAILAVADAAPQATVFLDEAYADFSGRTLIGRQDLETRPNIVVGRTFSKAFGLASLRAAAVVARGATLAALRGLLPPFNLNLAASVALPAALEDRRHYQAYLAEVTESKRRLYAFFARCGVEHWPSETNFVLARFGERTAEVMAHLRQRGVHVRDRSRDPACPGCVRITAGVAEHTQRCIDALEEVLCDAR
jgi:histidinol-phosphate aminotransferase